MGGFLREGFYLVQGDPGSGKTTLALQYILARKQAGERCLYVSLTESRRDLESTCRSHGWSLEGLDICDLTRSAANLVDESEASVFHPADIELGETTKAILSEVERVNPEHVVFDGLSEMRLLTGEPLRYRRQLLALREFFAERRVTVILLDDRAAQFGEIQPESLVGGNLVLERYLPEYGRARRRMYVTKIRGANFQEGYHDYEIVKGGVIIHPRLIAAEHHDVYPPSICPSGLPNLDMMLDGGLAAGTTTLLLGPAGVGKSTIAIQFVVQALKEGKKAAAYIFDEVMPILVQRSEKLCLGKEGGFQSYLSDGLLRIQQIDPSEMSPGAFAYEVRKAVEDGVRVVIIDSLNGYLNSMPAERFLSTHLHELFSYLNQKGVMTIMVVAQHGMMIGAGLPGDVDVSYLADTVLLFRYFEAQGEIHQTVSVVKKRTGPHERSLRQLRIVETGIEIGEPLREFRGIMTGVPQYEGAPRALAKPSGPGEKETE
jgi:circadian clock protein KaiC